jgi:predicted TIM-barrel fold metal-dependent hydrolase
VLAESIPVIDVDTHVIEPADLWTSRVSTKWGDRVPHVRWSDKLQMELWFSGDQALGPSASGAAAGWTEPPPKSPRRLADVSPELWRAADRAELMDRYGIHAAVLYPNVAGFGAGRFLETANGDDALARDLLAAYNDFLVDFSGEAPGRFVPVMAVPFWDLDLAVAEMERSAANGHRGIIFSQSPEYFGQPVLSDPHWDRLWAAAQDLGLPVNFHIAGGDMSGVNLLHASCGPHTNYASFPVTFFLGNARTIASLIGGGVCHRFPQLDFVSVESGVGWIPFVLQALDWMWQETHVTDEHPEYDLLPSEYCRRQIYGCFWFESGPTLDAAIDYLGPDNVLYETDFPHPTSMSPGPVSTARVPKDFIESTMGHLPEPMARKILHDNAARLYHLD